MMEIEESEIFDFPQLANYIEENYDKDTSLKNRNKVMKKVMKKRAKS